MIPRRQRFHCEEQWAVEKAQVSFWAATPNRPS
jgi:hypothetical protein